ncbi:MAG: hypothetical protein ACI9D0_002032 [Bacteroidia bacterium]|jgi:hypothetical protein
MSTLRNHLPQRPLKGLVLIAQVGLGLLLCAAALDQDPVAAGQASESEVSVEDGTFIQGMTISCQSWGWEWGTDGFGEELDDLQALGVNWIAIHPYGSLRDDGSISYRAFDSTEPNATDAAPTWLTRPIREAKARGMGIMIKPHIAYWGSPFSWRGEIAFDDAEVDARFWESYRKWILDLAKVCADADAFIVGTELELQLHRDEQWRELIRDVRGVTDANLSYCSNWDSFERVPFWDALDAIGVQAYFPVEPSNLEPGAVPAARDIRAAWEPWLGRLRATSERVGKNVFFGELGYDSVESAAARPWEGISRSRPATEKGDILQERCLNVAFEVMEANKDWLRGAFLWKWFVGSSRHANFQLAREETRKIIKKSWGQTPIPAK